MRQMLVDILIKYGIPLRSVGFTGVVIGTKEERFAFQVGEKITQRSWSPEWKVGLPLFIGVVHPFTAIKDVLGDL